IDCVKTNRLSGPGGSASNTAIPKNERAISGVSMGRRGSCNEKRRNERNGRKGRVCDNRVLHNRVPHKYTAANGAKLLNFPLWTGDMAQPNSGHLDTQLQHTGLDEFDPITGAAAVALPSVRTSTVRFRDLEALEAAHAARARGERAVTYGRVG